MTVRWDSLSAECVREWAQLTNLLAEVDGTEEFYEAEDLAEKLIEPGLDPVRDTVALWNDGALIGYGQLGVKRGPPGGNLSALLGGGVHPDHRGRGIGVRVRVLLEARAMQLGGERGPGVPVHLRVPGGIEGASVRRLLEHRGYAIERYYRELERPIPGAPIAEPSVAVTPYSAELSEQVRLAHNDAFSTHWGSTPRDPLRWQSYVGSRSFRSEAGFVSLAADGRVLAYTLVCEWAPGEAWVDLVGTRQEARGRGLARACLSASLRSMAGQGYTMAGLSVDSENAQGAGALYSSAGFELQRVVASYGKVVPALGAG